MAPARHRAVLVRRRTRTRTRSCTRTSLNLPARTGTINEDGVRYLPPIYVPYNTTSLAGGLSPRAGPNVNMRTEEHQHKMKCTNTAASPRLVARMFSVPVLSAPAPLAHVANYNFPQAVGAAAASMAMASSSDTAIRSPSMAIASPTSIGDTAIRCAQDNKARFELERKHAVGARARAINSEHQRSHELT